MKKKCSFSILTGLFVPLFLFVVYLFVFCSFPTCTITVHEIKRKARLSLFLSVFLVSFSYRSIKQKMVFLIQKLHENAAKLGGHFD